MIYPNIEAAAATATTEAATTKARETMAAILGDCGELGALGRVQQRPNRSGEGAGVADRGVGTSRGRRGVQST